MKNLREEESLPLLLKIVTENFTKMISLEFSNHIKTFDYKSQRSDLEREAIEKVIAGESLLSVFEKHKLSLEQRRKLLKTKVAYPHKGEESSLFLLSIACGHVDLAKSLIEEQVVDIEERGTVLVGVYKDGGFGYEVGEDVTPLWCAAAWCKFELVKLLAKHGANINHRSKVGSSPLLVACRYFHLNRARQVLLGKPDVPVQLELVKFLLDNGANVNEAGHLGDTPLTAAALSGFKDPSLVAYLLKKGADPNAKNALGFTALHLAAQKGCLESVKVLIKNGAQLGAGDTEGITPLQLACCECHDSVVEWIISQPDCSREWRINALELLGASHATSIDVDDIEYPSEGQSEEEYADDMESIQHGYNLLLRAKKERFEPPTNIVKQVLTPPLTVYNNQVESQSLEELEALSTNHEVIQIEGFLIRDRILGALRSSEILQPLFNKAIVLSHIEELQMAANFYSHALSFRLVSSDTSREILRRLLDLFASMIEKGIQLKTANLEPVHQYILVWLKILTQERERQHFSHFEQQELKWAFDHNLLLVFYFICILSNISAHSDEEAKKKKEMIKKIMDLKLQNSQGSDMFHLAVWDSVIEVHNKVCLKEIFKVPNMKVLEILLQSGGNINSQDHSGNTPLHVLMSVDPKLAIVPSDFKENEGKDYIKWFVQNGAKVDLKNMTGECPVDIAVSEIAKEFLKKL